MKRNRQLASAGVFLAACMSSMLSWADSGAASGTEPLTAEVNNNGALGSEKMIRSASALGAMPGAVVDKSKTFNHYQWLSAHNAFAKFPVFFPNQYLSISDQLQRGVRSLMLDVHGDEVKLCHNSMGCNGTLVSALTTVVEYLEANPEAVVTIHIEDHTTRGALQNGFDKVPGLGQYVFNPTLYWSERSEWPTLQEMLDTNQRLILMVQGGGHSGHYNSNVYVFFDQAITVENYWSMGNTIGEHDLTCRTRWSHIPLSDQRARSLDFYNWSRLFVINHFHGAAEVIHSNSDNELGGSIGLHRRVTEFCRVAAGRDPNYIAVDFVDGGDALEYVEMNNNGGIIAHEGNNATQSLVCSFSTAFDRSINLQSSDRERLGCENDEMRSLSLHNVKAGQRVTLYDRSNSSRDDDYAILDILKDTNLATVGSFERDELSRSDYRLRYSGGNGLDGKVSHIKVEPTPTRYSEAAIVMLAGNEGAKEVVCTFGITTSFSRKLSDDGCANDKARSAKLMAGQAGRKIVIMDSPSINWWDDDSTWITIKKDFDTPIVLDTFERSFETDTLKVEYRRKNGLDGKVSSIMSCTDC